MRRENRIKMGGWGGERFFGGGVQMNRMTAPRNNVVFLFFLFACLDFVFCIFPVMSTGLDWIEIPCV